MSGQGGLRQRRGELPSKIAASGSDKLLSVAEVKAEVTKKYSPSKSIAGRVQQNVYIGWCRYKALLGGVALDGWEFVIVCFLLAGILGLIGFGAFKQLDKLAHLTIETMNRNRS